MLIVRLAPAAAIACLLMGVAPVARETPMPTQAQFDQIAAQLSDLRAAEKVRDLQREERAAKREADDLIAQQSMAASTDKISKLTETQIWLGFATLGGLLITVYFGRRTLSQGGTALEENRRYSEMELRSYVGPLEQLRKNVTVGLEPEFRTRLKNFGKTPAYNLRSATYASWTEELDRDKTVLLPDRFILQPHFSTVMPDGTASTTAYGPVLTAEMMQKMSAFKGGYEVVCVVTYTDAFGDDHISKTAMLFFGPKLEETGVIPSFEHQDHIDFPKLNIRPTKTDGKFRRVWREVTS